jgi:succinate-acetate transporter protein
MTEKTTANPIPLGLLGFGLTTVLFGLYCAQIIDASALGVFYAIALFYGGLAQVVAGRWALKTGNTYWGTVLCSYGFFWLTYVGANLLAVLGLVPSISSPAIEQLVMVPFYFLWGFIAFWMFLSAMKLNRTTRALMLLLAGLFWLLALGHYAFYAYGVTIINTIAGYEGIACGLVALYLSLGLVMNDAYARDVVPL